MIIYIIKDTLYTGEIKEWDAPEEHFNARKLHVYLNGEKPALRMNSEAYWTKEDAIAAAETNKRREISCLKFRMNRLEAVTIKVVPQ